MIRRAKIQELPEIMALSRACARHMTDKGIFQWNEHYPSEQAFKKDISRDELYVLEAYDRIIGTITITILMDKEYLPVRWLTENTRNIYIHRLAVHPEYQSKGYAQQLMNFAEEYSMRENFISVRLDTFSKNLRNQRFYEKRGYTKLDDVYFPNQSEFPFHCYELIL